MKKAYEQIKEIMLEADYGVNTSLNMTLHLSKLIEEVGEMAQSMNKLNGRKKRSDTEPYEEILENIREEAADSIQCLMAIAINAGVDYESLKKTLEEKNKKFKDSIQKKK